MFHWRALRIAILALTAACGTPSPDRAASGADASHPRGRLFPPAELGALEAPDRAEWQQPERVMDALNIADGSRVADIGAGGGWFTRYLAHRVGPNGVVFAEDIQPAMIASIERRVQGEGLKNVRPVIGTPDDPRLPPGLDAVLLVDTYPQIPNPVAMLTRIASALAPGGLVGIVDFKTDGAGGPGPARSERVAPAQVVADAGRAGLRLRREERFLRYQYMLIFAK